MTRPIKIFSLTASGARLAERLVDLVENSEHLANAKPFAQQVQTAFQQGDALILICATGIAVRTLAPVLQSKLTDPPVLVLDEQGQFVIPLLSGHEGGANAWAQRLAEQLQAQLVFTTAKGYLKPVYAVGMGCERGCSKEHLAEMFQQALMQTNLKLADINSLNSIDIKADEQGLIELAADLKLPYQTFDVDRLKVVEPLLSTRSEYVYNTVGVYGVAESAALVAAMAAVSSDSNQQKLNNTELVLNKIKTPKATVAIARCFLDE